ncbi:MAG: hypothetical protein ND866_00200 [Pyrinomonadaceae bacterium]|nr:hypothetical protein [Pyrinomonadaceae bacterium]
MKRINRLISTFACTLALLISTCPPAQADHQGELRRDLAWNLNVDNSSASAKTSVTVHYLISRNDEIEISREEIEIFTIPSGSPDPNAGRVQLRFPKPGRGVRRIIIDVDPPINTSITVNVSQFAAFPADIGPGFGRLVFDIIDGP